MEVHKPCHPLIVASKSSIICTYMVTNVHREDGCQGKATLEQSLRNRRRSRGVSPSDLADRL